jgi:transposase
MTNGILTMSTKELDRLAIIQKVESKLLTQVEAASLLNITTRHLRRLQHKFKKDGPRGLLSKKRGKQSNNRLNQTLKANVKELIKTHYFDFGPTFANEKLKEIHQLNISVESTRQIMLVSGIWKGKKRKALKSYQSRARRSCYGELIQIDGSPHDWFEGRRERCCLLVFIDDATSRLMWLHFAEEETTAAYFIAMEAYLKRYGRPLSLYSDRNTIFRVQIKEATGGTGESQFSRAMRELNIELICANSPQAKGRVEKANGTLQDRLIKEMRLKGISDIPAANAFLPKFMEGYNKRFAVEPANSNDAHRGSIPDEETLHLIFSQQHRRTVSKNLELSYRNVIYQIQVKTPSYGMRKSLVTICDREGKVSLLYKGKLLDYRIYDKENKPTKVMNKMQVNIIMKNKRWVPEKDHPWRNYLKKISTRAATSTAV